MKKEGEKTKEEMIERDTSTIAGVCVNDTVDRVEWMLRRPRWSNSWEKGEEKEKEIYIRRRIKGWRQRRKIVTNVAGKRAYNSRVRRRIDIYIGIILVTRSA